MSYSTHQDHIDHTGETELIQLTDRQDRSDPENAGTIDYAVLDSQRNRATSYIDGYVRGFALSSRDLEFLKFAECVLTRYFLYKDAPTEHVKEEYLDIKARLKDIKAELFANGAMNENTNDDIEYTTADTVFSSTNLTGF